MQETGHADTLKEPFAGLFTQGMVVHETYRDANGGWVSPSEIRVDLTPEGRRASRLDDGAPVEIGPIEKMSKSKRNTIDPDEIIETYGADTARWVVLSDSPPEGDVIWTDAGVQGAAKFVQRAWRLVDELVGLAAPLGTPAPAEFSATALDIRKVTHAALVKVEEDIQRLRFNRAVAQIYDLANKLSAAVGTIESAEIGEDLRFAFREAADIFVQLFAPMMPHLAEESWARLGHATLVAEAAWPIADHSLIVENMMSLPVQVNGKKRADLVITRDADAATIEKAAVALEGVQRALEGKAVKKVIIVPQRIVNVVA
jgi:leucyl-tRNA synthetase